MFDKTLQLREKWEMEERWIVDEKTNEGLKRRIDAGEINDAKGSDEMMKGSKEVKGTEGTTGGEKTRRTVGAKGSEDVRGSIDMKTLDKKQ